MPEQRMSAQLTRLAKKQGRLPALVTALALAAVVLVQSLLSSLLVWVGGALYERVSFGADAFEGTPWNFDYFLDPFLKVTLPFAVGMFISLWLIAPIAAELTLRFVITRAFLASAAGALVALVVNLFIYAVTHIRLGFEIRGFAHSALLAISQAIDVFIYTTPIAVLAVTLLWLWLRAHPREYEVAGLIDEL